MAEPLRCSLPEHPRFLAPIAALNLILLVIIVVASANQLPNKQTTELLQPTSRYLVAQNSSPIVVTITAGASPKFYLNRNQVNSLNDLATKLTRLHQQLSLSKKTLPIAVIARDPSVTVSTEQAVIKIIQQTGFQCALAELSESQK